MGEKKYRKKVGELKDEIAEFEEIRESLETELNEAIEREKNARKQLKMMKQSQSMECSEKAQNKKEYEMTYQLLSKPPSRWNNEDVKLWLSHIGMNEYEEAMDNVDGNILINMKNKRDFRKWGIEKNGVIKKMMREIKDLKAREDIISNLRFDNEKLKESLDEITKKKSGPKWDDVHSLHRKLRDLEGRVRREKYERENILINVKDAIKNDKRFDNISPEYKDILAEVHLLKGALSHTQQKLNNKNKQNKVIQGSEYEWNQSPEDKLKDFGVPIGRFLQKWYVLANHDTQYWISRTNEELDKRDKHYDRLKKENKKNKEYVEEYTESMDWILFDTRKKRLISEFRVSGRGAPNDPKDIKLQMSASSSGPWTTVKEHTMNNDGKRENVGGFECEARFWRLVFMNNYGGKDKDMPRFVLYECQFWGPLDDEVENTHFIME